MYTQDNVQWLMNSSAALLNESIELGNAEVIRTWIICTIVPGSCQPDSKLYNHTEIQCSTSATDSSVLLLLQGHVMLK